MQVKCPICGKDGSLQQRYNSVRVGHYKGFKKTEKGHIIIVEWHSTTIQNLLLVNKSRIYLNQDGKLTLFTDKTVNNEEKDPKDHYLPEHQTHNLEFQQGPCP